MTPEINIEEVLVRIFDGSSTELEMEQFLNWLKADQTRITEFIEMQEIWTGSSVISSDKVASGIALNKLHGRINTFERSRRLNKGIGKYILHVAAAILFIFSLTIIYQNKFSSEGNNYTNSNYYTEISTSGGNRSKITLPDGTKVWINANTTFRYPSVFESDKREVFVDGEIFLDVAKDSNRPFYVETSTLIMEVLGTSFNVNSYANDNIEQLTLVEGSLKIIPKIKRNKHYNSLTIKPNETATFFKNKKTLSVHQLESEPEKSMIDQKQLLKPDISSVKISELEAIISWKEDELIFKDESLEQMCIKMSRWYGINIIIEDEKLKNNRYTGKFIYNESINQVMDILQRTTPMKFKLDKDVLTISSTK